MASIILYDGTKMIEHLADSKPNLRRCRFESLECRHLLSVTVDTLLDVVDATDGLTSLREAIAATNSTSENEIDFSVLGAINLANGELEVTNSLTITGPGMQDLIISAQDLSRVINYSSLSGDLAISGVTLRNGRTTSSNARGGGIRFVSEDTLSLTDTIITNNSTTGASSRGGGIYTDSGDVILTNTVVRGNTTTGDRSLGAGISADTGRVNLIGSEVSGNLTLGEEAGGAGIFSSRGTVALTDSEISYNNTLDDLSFGGGIFTSSAQVNILRSSVSGNSTLGLFGKGGGISTVSGAVILTDSTVSNNSTFGYRADGGGIDSGGQLIVRSSTISGNGTSGFDSDGGGAFAPSIGITLTDSTISGNFTLDADADGGGLATSPGADILSISNTTIANNIAGGRGGGVASLPGLSGLSWNLENSIIANNGSGSQGQDFFSDPDDVFAVDYSLVGIAEGISFGGIGNQVGSISNPVNPLLGPLVDNGGPTRTHSLLPGSPALDAGNSAITDQRGLVAPVSLTGIANIGDGSDIGAYEAQVAPSADFDSDGDVDGADFLAWQRGFGKLNAQRADGNSDDDGDTDVSDLAAWDLTYGHSQGHFQASTELIAEVVDAALAILWTRTEPKDLESSEEDSDSAEFEFDSKVSVIKSIQLIGIETLSGALGIEYTHESNEESFDSVFDAITKFEFENFEVLEGVEQY